MLNAGTRTLSVTFTPTDATNYAGASKSVTIEVAQGDSSHHLECAGRHHLRHRTRRGAVSATTTVAGTLTYDPTRRDGAERGDTDAVGHLHADRRHQLHARDQVGPDRRGASHAGDHVECACRHHYGTALSATQLNATTSVPGNVRPTTPLAGTVLNAGTQIAGGDLHPDRRRQLHRRLEVGRDRRRAGDARDYLERAWPASSTAPRSARRN